MPKPAPSPSGPEPGGAVLHDYAGEFSSLVDRAEKIGMTRHYLCRAAQIPGRTFRRYLVGELGNWEKFSAAFIAIRTLVEDEEARLRSVLKLNGAKRK